MPTKKSNRKTCQTCKLTLLLYTVFGFPLPMSYTRTNIYYLPSGVGVIPDVDAGVTLGLGVTAGGDVGVVPEVDVVVTPGVVPDVGVGEEIGVPPVVGVAPPVGVPPVVGVTSGDDVGVPPGVNTMMASKWPVSALSS